MKRRRVRDIFSWRMEEIEKHTEKEREKREKNDKAR
jgi:hypothetical protein